MPLKVDRMCPRGTKYNENSRGPKTETLRYTKMNWIRGDLCFEVATENDLSDRYEENPSNQILIYQPSTSAY